MYMIHSKLKLQGLFDEVRELSRSEDRIRLDGLESMKWRFLSFWFFEDPMKLRTHWSLELLVSAWGWVVLDEREWFAVTDHRITRSRESLISSVWFKSSGGSFLILSSYSGLQHRIAPRMMGVRKHHSWSNPVPGLNRYQVWGYQIMIWSDRSDRRWNSRSSSSLALVHIRGDWFNSGSFIVTKSSLGVYQDWVLILILLFVLSIFHSNRISSSLSEEYIDWYGSFNCLVFFCSALGMHAPVEMELRGSGWVPPAPALSNPIRVGCQPLALEPGVRPHGYLRVKQALEESSSRGRGTTHPRTIGE